MSPQQNEIRESATELPVTQISHFALLLEISGFLLKLRTRFAYTNRVPRTRA